MMGFITYLLISLITKSDKSSKYEKAVFLIEDLRLLDSTS